MEGIRQTILGDIHGHEGWKRIADKHYDDTDRFIFVGDYLDSFLISAEKQLNNLRDIIAFKKILGDKLILLIGNHDYHYMNNGTYDKYSGYQVAMHPIFNETFQDNIDLFQMAFKDEYDTIYSHAGISETWLNRVQISSTDPKVIVDSINELFKNKPSRFSFNQADRGGYGDITDQSPIWIRPNSLYKDQINFQQVVGHTIVNKIDHPPKSERRGFYLIDCLHQGEYLRREGEKITIQKIKKQ